MRTQDRILQLAWQFELSQTYVTPSFVATQQLKGLSQHCLLAAVVTYLAEVELGDMKNRLDRLDPEPSGAPG